MVASLTVLALCRIGDLSRLYLAVPTLYGSWDRLQAPCDPEKDKQKRMDGCTPKCA